MKLSFKKGISGVYTICFDKKSALVWKTGIFVLWVFVQSCKKYELIAIENNIILANNLSDYHIFKGRPADLIPADNYHVYELATPLFTDYAEKQRLIKLPAGSSIIPSGNGLPEFPDGTILVKTFYYFNDKRNQNQGRQLIETRLLIKDKLQWSVGTYVWNKDQTDATLQTGGSTRNISWIDDAGKNQVINYHIPSNTECTTCHQANRVTLPIGPKLMNLNRSVEREGNEINQLAYFQKIRLLSSLTPSIDKLPDWQDTSFSLSERGRAYLDVNCSHCHNSKGYAAKTKIFFDYETTADNSQISKKGDKIISAMSASTIKDRMPKLGTTVIDEQGLALIKAYIKGL